ncbi:MAG: hypothetical protein JNL58_30910 [Planctomyces sp.]|nr:hypothetical protein [Planctomyces sp.]
MVLAHWLGVLRSQLGLSSRSASHRKLTVANFGTEALEFRCLLSATVGFEEHGDDDHGHEDIRIFFDASGNELCEMPEIELDHHEFEFENELHESDSENQPEDATTIAGGTNTGGSSPFLLSQTFFLHSNPGARHTIYLDFNGHTTSGTSWNSSFTGGAAITTPEYDVDDVAGFSNTELANIQRIWQRVAEDFIAFNVNVTTEAPADINDLMKSGTGDTRWGVRVAIGGSSYDWYGAGAGGVAYIGSFNSNIDTPTFVFTDQLGNGNVKYTAEAVSHEVGHTLGLRHDGTPTTGYYSGHGSGDTGWAPIMGVGYYQNLSQWSSGQYASANNLENDLSIITTQNGFGYRVDDYGNSIVTASAANIVNSTTIDGAGVLEQNTDTDFFQFVTGAGSISLTVTPFEIGPNLDIQAQLFDSAGTLLVSANPAASLGAAISLNVGAGAYYLSVTGVGNGDPLTTGYTDYGSIGQYSFVGTIISTGSLPSISVGDASTDEGGNLTFSVSLSTSSAESVTVQYSTSNGSATAGSDFVQQSGTVTFVPGETTKTVTITSLQDSTYESTESLTLNLTNPIGAVLNDAQGSGTIRDDDPLPPPSISISDVSVNEGKLNTSGKNSGQPQLTNMTFTVSLSSASTQTVSVSFATQDGTATVANSDYRSGSGTIVFNPGETSKAISVVIVGDNTAESNESFNVSLSNASNAVLADAIGVGTILNDDSTGGKGGKPSRGALLEAKVGPMTTPLIRAAGASLRMSSETEVVDVISESTSVRESISYNENHASGESGKSWSRNKLKQRSSGTHLNSITDANFLSRESEADQEHGSDEYSQVDQIFIEDMHIVCFSA